MSVGEFQGRAASGGGTDVAVLEKVRAAFAVGDYRQAARLLRFQSDAQTPAMRADAAQLLAPLSIDPVMVIVYGLCLTVLGWAGVSYLQ